MPSEKKILSLYIHCIPCDEMFQLLNFRVKIIFKCSLQKYSYLVPRYVIVGDRDIVRYAILMFLDCGLEAYIYIIKTKKILLQPKKNIYIFLLKNIYDPLSNQGIHL